MRRKCKCKRKRRSHVERKCKEAKIRRRSQAESKFLFSKMADDSEALVFSWCLYTECSKDEEDVPRGTLSFACCIFPSIFFSFLRFNSAQLLSYSTGYLLTLSANFSSEWKPPSFFQLRGPVVAWKRWNVKKLFVLYLCICIYFCVASVYTCEMQTQAQEHEFFFISRVCVCICVDVVHTYIS